MEKTKIRRLLRFIQVLLLIIFIILFVRMIKDSTKDEEINTVSSTVGQEGLISVDEVPSKLINSSLNVDFYKTSIDLDLVLSGGPGKDGIPALTNPNFVDTSISSVKDEVQVMYIENNGEEKLYPYSILVWHEIVNDSVGDKDLAITFCPLCGSAIVFDRKVNDKVLDFGVSGFLYQSNLLMYSREESESLWSQSLGESVIGDRVGQKLEHVPFELLSFKDAKEKFPDALIMSTETGYTRNYTTNPYAGYDETEDTYFPVTVSDKRFPAKEVFFIVPLEGNSVAVRQDKEDGVYNVPDSDVKITVDKGSYSASWGDAEIPSYFEMWFSWANNNQETGTVLD